MLVYQCSGVGSVSFCASRICKYLCESGAGSRSFYQQATKMLKNLLFYSVLWLLNDLQSLKTDKCTFPIVSNEQKNLFLFGFLKGTDDYSRIRIRLPTRDPDPGEPNQWGFGSKTLVDPSCFPVFRIQIHRLSMFLGLSDTDPMTNIGSGSWSISQRHGSAGPDPHQHVMDPEHWCFLCLQGVLRRDEGGAGHRPVSGLHRGWDGAPRCHRWNQRRFHRVSRRIIHSHSIATTCICRSPWRSNPLHLE